MECELSQKKCVPCRGGVPPMKEAQVASLLKQLGGGWDAVENHHLEKEYAFGSFRENIAFVNRVADLAEEQGHHPTFHVDFRKTRVFIWTHKIDGLTESDFILAAKVDKVA